MIGKIRLSLQSSIILLLVLLIIPLSGLIISITYIQSSNSVEQLTNNLMESISLHTIDKSLNYLQPAYRGSELSQGLANARILRNDQMDELEKYFRELLEKNMEFVILHYGFENGDFMMVKRMPDKTYSTKWIKRRDGWAFTKWTHANPKWENQFFNKKEKDREAYDPRKRPWYQSAKKEKNAIWTDAYIYYSDRKPGITCASPIYSLQNNKLIGVIGIDIGIEEISKFIGGLKIGIHGKAMIINNKGELVAYPVKNNDDLSVLVREETVDGEKKVLLQHVLDSQDRELATSYRALIAKNVDVNQFDCRIISRQEIHFKHNGENYIGSYMPFPKDTGWPWIIGIIAPENDFMGAIKRNNIITLIISLVALILSLSLGIVLARKITKPLGVLSAEAKHIRHLELDSKISVNSRLTEIVDMTESFNNMKKGLSSFEKYVPSELVRILLQKDIKANLGVKKHELSILFSDIAGFTKISEKTDSKLLIKSLSEYFGEMSNLIHQQYGTIDKYIGDAIMAFWGAPNRIDNHALQACRTAILCNARLKELNKKWAEKGLPIFETRFGINSGEVLVGNVGCDLRMNYTVIGDSVNLASRLESINKVYGTSIIISGETKKQVEDQMAVRILDYISVVGKTKTTALFELICEKKDLDSELKIFIAKYSKALEFYLERKWEDALALFEEAETLKPGDIPCQILSGRCKDYSMSSPPKEWKGCFTLQSK